ncbi:hypothetical protein ABZ135_31215 [Streptomyces sp. NPDC006339]|uniref:hypothetical protein n=1 Tax=Streptomyces sp. NPDC006339 TaxID=3156755 RepID=UPI0033A6F1C8
MSSARRALTVAATTLLLWAAGTGLALAADGSASGDGGILGPLNVTSSEGVPLDRYELDPMPPAMPADGALDPATNYNASVMPMDDFGAQVRRFLGSGMFALARTITGFACWLIDWAYRFPVIGKLTSPAQKLADAYEQQIISPLGLAGICLAWAFVFGLVLIMRGRVARGAGEILLTLLIAGITATTLVQPAVLLGYDGPVQQTQRAALEAATITANSGNPTRTSSSPCDNIAGPAHSLCLQNQAHHRPGAPARPDHTKECAAIAGPARDVCRSGERPVNAADVSRPITNTLTETLVVQPYMLLQYGHVIDKDSPLYAVHLKAVTPPKPAAAKEECRLIKGPAYDFCQANGETWTNRAEEFKKLGPDGEAVFAYMRTNEWDKVIGALLVLIAALILALVVVLLALALITAQFGCVIAAVGTVVVFALALLPGPGRGLLWKWCGYLAGSMLILFAVAVFLPLFGIGARAILADTTSSLIERLVILDGLAATALVMQRRIINGSRQLGRRFSDRMRYAKIGGSHTMGESAASTAAAFSALGYGNTPGGAFPGHAAMLGRSGSFAAEALAEGSRALAPLALGARTAHTVLIGPKRPPVQPEAVGPDGLPLPPGPAGRTRGGTTAPALVPAGSRLEASLKRTRAGRVLLGTTKAAFYSTIGAPAAFTRLHRFNTAASHELHHELGRQRDHYARVTGRWAQDTAAAFGARPAEPASAPPRTERRSYEAPATEPPRRRARHGHAPTPTRPATPGQGEPPRSWRRTWWDHQDSADGTVLPGRRPAAGQDPGVGE